MIIKMTILRLLGSTDDKEKEKIGIARPEALRIRSTGRFDAMGIGASGGSRKNRRHDILVQKGIEVKSAYRHQMNRWFKKGHQCIGRAVSQRQCKSRKSQVFSTG